MATLAKRLITADEFLNMEFDTGDSDVRFELDNGVIYAMAGGTIVHSRIQTNLLLTLTQRLSGTGCSAYGPDTGFRAHMLSLRYPDVSVYCGHDVPEDDKLKALSDPKIIVEVLSPGSRDRDIRSKLPEYRSVPSIEAILYVDPDDQTLHLETRDKDSSWAVVPPDEDGSVSLPPFDIRLTPAEVFARGR